MSMSLGPVVGRRSDYAAYLRAMHRFVARAALPGGTREHYLPLISADLGTLGIDADDAPSMEAAPGDRYERLGWAYVFEGSSLGARVLLRQAQGLGFDAVRGACYLNAHAASGRWSDVLRQLEDSTPDSGQLRRLVTASNTAFAAVEAALVDALRIERVHA
jgi:heme oxygenase (biliverdin-IX-beta and delta-forming)